MQNLRRVVIKASSIGQNRRSDLAPWGLLEHGVDTTFALDPPSFHDPAPQGDTVDQNDDLDQLQTENLVNSAPKHPKKPRVARASKTSRRGIQYPSLPTSVIKSISSTLARSAGLRKTHVNKDSLAAMMDASDWFFEQLSEDLGTYTKHAGRRKIDERDVSTFMKR